MRYLPWNHCPHQPPKRRRRRKQRQKMSLPNREENQETPIAILEKAICRVRYCLQNHPATLQYFSEAIASKNRALIQVTVLQLISPFLMITQVCHPAKSTMTTTGAIVVAPIHHLMSFVLHCTSQYFVVSLPIMDNSNNNKPCASTPTSAGRSLWDLMAK